MALIDTLRALIDTLRIKRISDVTEPKTTKPYYGHPMFYRIVEELKDLHSEKNRQYATKGNPLGNFERTGKMISKFLHKGVNPALASCLSLMSKQVDGIYEIVGESKANTIDSLEDKLKDVAVYSILAMIILAEAREKEKETHEHFTNNNDAANSGPGSNPAPRTNCNHDDYSTDGTGR